MVFHWFSLHIVDAFWEGVFDYSVFYYSVIDYSFFYYNVFYHSVFYYIVFYHSDDLWGKPLGKIFNEKRGCSTSWESIRGRYSWKNNNCLTFPTPDIRRFS